MSAVWPDRAVARSTYGRIRVVAFRGVLFDWRGTLVVHPTFDGWADAALRRLGRPDDATAVAARLLAVADELDGPGVDTDAVLHRDTYHRVLAGLGLDADLVTALYEVECDPAWNVFAEDAGEVLHALKGAGLRIAVISDIHVDIRPAFAAAGLQDVVDVFTLVLRAGRAEARSGDVRAHPVRAGTPAARGADGGRPLPSGRRGRRARDRDAAPPAARARVRPPSAPRDGAVRGAGGQRS
jgi:hypothetical protein